MFRCQQNFVTPLFESKGKGHGVTLWLNVNDLCDAVEYHQHLLVADAAVERHPKAPVDGCLDCRAAGRGVKRHCIATITKLAGGRRHPKRLHSGRLWCRRDFGSRKSCCGWIARLGWCHCGHQLRSEYRASKLKRLAAALSGLFTCTITGHAAPCHLVLCRYGA